MSMDSNRLDRMLQESRWLRPLALELLNDPSQADDVLQEVWMTALRRPPREVELRAQRSWLKKVLRTFALRANRSEGRRDRWERHSRPPSPVPSPDAMIDRLEMQSRLAGAIRSLPEPYRTVVFLRFYEEASTNAIAESRGVPASTVRTQLQRGLAMLRDRLDQELGEEGREWRSLMLLFVPGDRLAPLAPSTTPRAMPIEARGKFVAPASLAAAGVVAALLWLTLSVLAPSSGSSSMVTGEVGSADRSSRRSNAMSPSVPATARSTSPKGESTSPSSVARVATSSAPLPASTEEIPAPPETCPLVVIDTTNDRPVSGAVVIVVGVDDPRGREVGQSDPDGRVSIPVAAYCRESLRIVADGYVEYREPARRRSLEGHAAVIRLTPVYPASVRVMTPADLPAIGLTVRVGPAESSPHGARTVEELTTDEQGVVHFLVRFERMRVDVFSDEYARVSIPMIGRETTVRLEPGRPLAAQVTNVDGIPLPDVFLVTRSDRCRRLPSEGRTDEQGRIDLGRWAENDRATFEIHPVDRPAMTVTCAPPEGTTWTLVVPEGAIVTGTITCEGTPVADAIPFLVRREAIDRDSSEGAIPAVDSKRSSGGHRARYRLVPYCRGTCGPDGSFEVGPIATTDELYLLLHHDRWCNRVIALNPDRTSAV
ncbi:MAG: sigma-70 family RNA polymerase sigma factor, partial [Planctomycetes bacterium]|nr:sigma-70 family RNA polymerase sigma factor [Planctomycetota bacterium]